MKTEKKSFLNTLFAYAGSEKKKMIGSVILSVLSVTAGLIPFYCMYKLICLFVSDTVTAGGIVQWCLLALAAYAVKILTFTLSTAASHSMAYTILEKLRRVWPIGFCMHRSAMWRITPSARSRA